MKKICHITTGLNIGGAEMFLVNLATSLKKSGYQQTVISLLSRGDLSGRVENENIDLIHLGINRYPWTWWSIIKLPFLLRRLSPDIVQTWLYHADLIGGLASIFCRAKLVWNIRQTDISLKNNKTEIYLVARLTGLISRFLPEKIICCSDSVKESHIEIGYCESKMMVIANGCDTSLYRFNVDERERIRKELELNRDVFVIGRFGRFDQQKDYQTFIAAMNIIQMACENICFIMAGEGITEENSELMAWITESTKPEQYMMLGKRKDLPALYQTIDILVSSSLGEGFPNVIAEAMSTERPCVATDVGESAELVAETGLIVPKSNAEELAQACMKMITASHAERDLLGRSARQRIEKNYSLELSVQQYREVYG